MTSLFRVDPTRTRMLRARACRAVTSRFQSLKRKLWILLVEDDILDLKKKDLFHELPLITNADMSSLRELQAWIKRELRENAADLDPTIKEAYLKGVSRAYDKTRKSGLKKKEIAALAKREFMNTQFGDTSVTTLAALRTQGLSELHGISKTMEQQIIRVVTEGLIKGDDVKAIGHAVSDRVNKIGITRANTLARTMIIKAHAEGALDSMEKLGVQNINVEVEWSTAGDSKVCPLCKPLENVIIPLKEARGMFPRHPNCRCTPIPSLESVNRKRFRSAIRKSVKASSRKDTWNG